MKCSQKHLLKLNFGHFKHRIFRNPQKSIMKHSCPQSSMKPSWFCIAWTAGSSWNCSFLASRQKESYIGNEQDHLLVQTEQSPCSTNHMWCGWHWGKEGKIICKWEASRLVCIPWMKAVISQMHNSLLPNDREGEQKEAIGEIPGSAESPKIMTGTKRTETEEYSTGQTPGRAQSFQMKNQPSQYWINLEVPQTSLSLSWPF